VRPHNWAQAEPYLTEADETSAARPNFRHKRRVTRSAGNS
jgi:hypothetical protein